MPKYGTVSQVLLQQVAAYNGVTGFCDLPIYELTMAHPAHGMNDLCNAAADYSIEKTPAILFEQ